MIPWLVFAATTPGAFIELSKYGAVCNGIADTSAAWASASAEAIAAGSGASTIHVAKGVCAINSTMTVTASVALDPGAQMAVGAGKVVTIAGVPIADHNQFLFPGAGSIKLPNVDRVYTRWWGSAQGGADVGASYNAADNALSTVGPTAFPDLNTQAGTIEENSGGGNYATAALVSSWHTGLFHAGRFTSTVSGNLTSPPNVCQFYGAYIIAASNSKILGDGPLTHFQESTGTGPDGSVGDGAILADSNYNVICVNPDSDNAGELGANVEIGNLTIDGLLQNGPYGEALSAIQAFDITGFRVHDVTTNNIRSFSLYVGGTGDEFQTLWQGDANYAGNSFIFEPPVMGNNGWQYVNAAACLSAPAYAYNGLNDATINFPTVWDASVTEILPDGGAGCTWIAKGIPHANDVWFTNNTFNGTFAQSVGCVNCLNFNITDNHIIGRHPLASNGVPTAIDVELNTTFDLLEYCHVDRNTIDMRYGYPIPAGNPTATSGLHMNAGDLLGPNFSSGCTVNDNVIIGQDFSNIQNYYAPPVTALAVGMVIANLSHTTVRGNRVTGAYQIAYALGGNGNPHSGEAVLIEDNAVLDWGSLGNAIQLGGMSEALVQNNHMYGTVGTIAEELEFNPFDGGNVGNINNTVQNNENNITYLPVQPPIVSASQPVVDRLVNNVSYGSLWNANHGESHPVRVVVSDGGAGFFDDAGWADTIIEVDTSAGNVAENLFSALWMCPIGYYPDAGRFLGSLQPGTSAPELVVKNVSRSTGSHTLAVNPFPSELIEGDAAAPVLSAGQWVHLYGSCYSRGWEMY